MKDDLGEKGLSGEEVYDRAAWRRLYRPISTPHRSGIKMKKNKKKKKTVNYLLDWFF